MTQNDREPLKKLFLKAVFVITQTIWDVSSNSLPPLSADKVNCCCSSVQKFCIFFNAYTSKQIIILKYIEFALFCYGAVWLMIYSLTYSA